MKKDVIAPCVLIAVDGSGKSLQAADYVARMTKLIPNLEVVLMYVTPQIPPIYQAEAKKDGQMRKRLKELEKANYEKAEEILADAKKHLIENGIKKERIGVKIRKRISGLAKDIITEAELGRFDALIVGRRGITRTQELFMGSVTNQIIQHSANIPVWIIDGKVQKPKVLVAVDGSEASLRAVDHVAFMLGGNPDAIIDFLHVTPKLQSYCAIDLNGGDHHWHSDESELGAIESEFLREDEICLDDFNRKAIAILRKAGFTTDQIKIEEREITLGVARTIVKAADEGDYGTIVIGRRGLGKSSFLGSISDRVIRRAADKAIWLVN